MVLTVEVPVSPDKPLNHMQDEYLTAVGTDSTRGIRDKRRKKVYVRDNTDTRERFTLTCPILYYEEVQRFSFRHSSFKKNLPKWFCMDSYIITNAVLKLFLDYLKKRDAGYKELKAIADKGGLRDDEFIEELPW